MFGTFKSQESNNINQIHDEKNVDSNASMDGTQINNEEYYAQIDIFTENKHSLSSRLSYVVQSIPKNMPTVKDSMKIFFGMCTIIVIASILLSMCDSVVSKIVYALLGVNFNA